jgi:alkylation response protein AidB-like acyl-CoA dehydrogenase
MRGTVSRTLEFHDVFVPDGEQLLPRGVYFRAAIEWPYMFFTLAPTYVGLATASYEFTVDYLRGEVDGEARVRRSSPTKQLAVAEMRIKLEQLRSLFDRVIAEAHVSPGRDERIRMLAANYTIMEGANDLCRLAIRTCGGHSIQRRFPLERYYRDSRCGSLMLPFTAEICLERIGRDALYQPGERD